MSQLDPRRAYQITIVGKKGYGKSHLARWLFDGYPYDRLVVDTTGDVGTADGWTDVRGELPDRWPMRMDNERQTLRWVPNPSSSTYRDDMDRAVGLAYRHGQERGHCMLWLEEVHEVAPSNRTGPHMRRALRQGRHAHLTMLCTDPRPLTVDPLVIANSDYVYCFRLSNPDDRATVAKNIGLGLKEPIGDELADESLDDLLSHLEKRHYMRYDMENDELLVYPPLPAGSATTRAERHLTGQAS